MTRLTTLLVPICCHGSLLGWLGGSSSTYPAPVPPPGSRRVHGAPAYAVNEPSTSVYLGQGCFWHTQYDIFRIERDPAGPFRRGAGKRITALAGYAGGGWTAPAGRVCYHGEDASDYSLLGHSEAVEVQLDNGNGARRQMRALLAHYFARGFVGGKAGQPGRRRDPQDGGPQYRNVIGLPGGRHGAKDGLFSEVAAAAAAHAMPLRDGLGGAAGDTADEGVVYVYDSDAFPFFRAEAYHQVQYTRTYLLTYLRVLYQLCTYSRLTSYYSFPSHVSTCCWCTSSTPIACWAARCRAATRARSRARRRARGGWAAQAARATRRCSGARARSSRSQSRSRRQPLHP